MAAHNNIGGLLRRHGYTELKKVGEGSFGKAILVQAEDKSKLICKMVDVSKATAKETQDAVKEGRVLASLKHPYIVRYRENFTESGWLCILMDFCEGGDLAKRITDAKRSRKPFSEEQVLKWFTQAILALKYLHEQHILHRDLKPQNFFLNAAGAMKMGDFGISKVLNCTLAVARTQVGTPYYLSPELCQERPYTWPSDIWAMGCILYELCALKVPFDAASIPALVREITKGAIPSVPRTYSSFMQMLCPELLNRIPDKRPSAEEILERPKIKEIMKLMLDAVGGAQQEEAAVLGGEDNSSAANAAPRAAPQAAAGGPYAAKAGGYRKDDLVEYHSSLHKSWLPAVVIAVDDEGRVLIDLKPNTWLSKEQQSTSIRPRSPGAQPSSARRPSGSSAASPRRGRSTSADKGSQPGSSPTPQQRPSSRGASPMPWQRPALRGASPRPGSRGGGGVPASPSGRRGASPAPATPALRVGGSYRSGDLVDYYSSSHSNWLPATVINADASGSVIIDLKPNTWISKDDCATKIRPRGAPASADCPASGRAASPMRRVPSAGGGLGRRPSGGGGLAVPSPSWRSPSADRGFGGPRAGTPLRARSPCNGSGRPGSRGASPAPVLGASPGVPRPGLRRPGDERRTPSSGGGAGPSRVSDSPLRRGGMAIAGV